MSRVLWRMPVLLALLCAPEVASGAAPADGLAGHLSIGYAKLLVTDAPGGSISMAAGLDYPLAH